METSTYRAMLFKLLLTAARRPDRHHRTAVDSGDGDGDGDDNAGSNLIQVQQKDEARRPAGRKTVQSINPARGGPGRVASLRLRVFDVESFSFEG